MKTNLNIDLPFIRQWVRRTGPYATGNIEGSRLYTALQPIYSLAHRRIVGYEALVRVKDETGESLSPADLFSRERSDAETTLVDRLCRFIHAHNFRILKDTVNWLFLNVSPQVIASGNAFGSFFRELLAATNLPPHRVVIEVVEHPIANNDLIKDTIQFYKDLGCLIAIDDFGAGHSNFNRIWTLKPDIVKLDRSFLSKADTAPDIRALLPGIVSLLHQAGALVLMEGIETPTHALIAIESEADFVQGFFFGRPFTDLHVPKESFQGFSDLMSRYKEESFQTEVRFKQGIHKYQDLFSRAVTQLKDGLSMEEACHELLSTPKVMRCYCIGTDGIQIGNTLVSRECTTRTDKRFRPIEQARSADWFRRHYLRRAIFHPEQLQITRPYLSITGAHMCVTLSTMFSCPGADSVLCCDLEV